MTMMVGSGDDGVPSEQGSEGVDLSFGDSLGEGTAAEDAAHDGPVRWSGATIVISLSLFLAAALAEIGGGWLVWQAVREGRPWWWAALGALVLVLYGFIPTWQPVDDFGRTYAVYGGVFIALSYLWGWLVDGLKMDGGDWTGSVVALTGVAIAWFWPR